MARAATAVRSAHGNCVQNALPRVGVAVRHIASRSSGSRHGGEKAHDPTERTRPYRPDYSLRPESRAAIDRAPHIGTTVRDVTCTADEACDMLDYFRSAADALTAIADPEAPFCARARDTLQNALRVAGIICAGDRTGKGAVDRTSLPLGPRASTHMKPLTRLIEAAVLGESGWAQASEEPRFPSTGMVSDGCGVGWAQHRAQPQADVCA